MLYCWSSSFISDLLLDKKKYNRSFRFKKCLTSVPVKHDKKALSFPVFNYCEKIYARAKIQNARNIHYIFLFFIFQDASKK